MSNGGRYLLGGALVFGGFIAASGRFEPLAHISIPTFASIPPFGPVAIGLLCIACGLVMLTSKKPSRPSQSRHDHPPPLDADSPYDSPIFDRTKLKERFLFELKPAQFLATLRKQLRRLPDYSYCNIVIENFASLSGPYSDAIDATVDWALSDTDIAAARAALQACGFAIDIGTDEDPGHRDLYIGVSLYDDPERAMRILEERS